MAKPQGFCAFCRIAVDAAAAPVVFEDENSLAFLDHRPVFPGHTLVVPKDHIETLADLPAALIQPFFMNVQLLAQAVEQALAAEGTFVAINSKVSQSVPHLHVHIVPRRKKDGLRGFFWPRQVYKDPAVMASIRKSISDAATRLTAGR